MIDTYAWPGGQETMLRMGPRDGPTILILQPLFEEANRTRRLLADVMRGLAARGIESVLPDLPGTNDSPVATADARFTDWSAAVTALAATLPVPSFTVSIRGGALLDGFAGAGWRWRLAPETGARLLRDMVRATAMTGGAKAGELEATARTQPTRLAGNVIDPALFAALEASVPEAAETVRVARLAGDAGDADVLLPGTPLWRRAEPGEDDVLAAAMIDDIAQWVASCAVR